MEKQSRLSKQTKDNVGQSVCKLQILELLRFGKWQCPSCWKMLDPKSIAPPPRSSAACPRCTGPGKNAASRDVPQTSRVVPQAILRTSQWRNSSPSMGTFGDLSRANEILDSTGLVPWTHAAAQKCWGPHPFWKHHQPGRKPEPHPHLPASISPESQIAIWIAHLGMLQTSPLIQTATNTKYWNKSAHKTEHFQNYAVLAIQLLAIGNTILGLHPGQVGAENVGFARQKASLLKQKFQKLKPSSCLKTDSKLFQTQISLVLWYVIWICHIVFWPVAQNQSHHHPSIHLIIASAPWHAPAGMQLGKLAWWSPSSKCTICLNSHRLTFNHSDVNVCVLVLV